MEGRAAKEVTTCTSNLDTYGCGGMYLVGDRVRLAAAAASASCMI